MLLAVGITTREDKVFQGSHIEVSKGPCLPRGGDKKNVFLSLELLPYLI